LCSHLEPLFRTAFSPQYPLPRLGRSTLTSRVKPLDLFLPLPAMFPENVDELMVGILQIRMP